MSNLNTPNGFASRPLTRWNRYYVPQADTNVYRVGDFVRSAGGTDASGTVAVSPHPGSAVGMRGVIVSIDPGLPSTGGLQASGQKLSVPAVKTRDYYLWVNDDPAAIYVAVDDGLTPANLTAANVGSFANFTPGVAAGVNGGSTAALTSSTFGGASGSGCLKVLGILPPSSYGANAAWLVQSANHELSTGQGPGTGSGITAVAQASDFNTVKLPAQVTDITAAATAAANAQTTANSAATAASGAQSTASAAASTASAAAAKAQTFALTFYVPTVADGDLVRIPVVFGLTVTNVAAESAAGTTTLTPKIGSTAMTGTAVSVTTTKSNQNYTANNAAVAGNDLVFTASSSSSCTGLAVTATYTRNLS
jgi:hypothetical protein